MIFKTSPKTELTKKEVSEGDDSRNGVGSKNEQTLSVETSALLYRSISSESADNDTLVALSKEAGLITEESEQYQHKILDGISSPSAVTGQNRTGSNTADSLMDKTVNISSSYKSSSGLIGNRFSDKNAFMASKTSGGNGNYNLALDVSSLSNKEQNGTQNNDPDTLCFEYTPTSTDGNHRDTGFKSPVFDDKTGLLENKFNNDAFSPSTNTDSVLSLKIPVDDCISPDYYNCGNPSSKHIPNDKNGPSRSVAATVEVPNVIPNLSDPNYIGSAQHLADIQRLACGARRNDIAKMTVVREGPPVIVASESRKAVVTAKILTEYDRLAEEARLAEVAKLLSSVSDVVPPASASGVAAATSAFGTAAPAASAGSLVAGNVGTPKTEDRKGTCAYRGTLKKVKSERTRLEEERLAKVAHLAAQLQTDIEQRLAAEKEALRLRELKEAQKLSFSVAETPVLSTVATRKAEEERLAMIAQLNEEELKREIEKLAKVSHVAELVEFRGQDAVDRQLDAARQLEFARIKEANNKIVEFNRIAEERRLAEVAKILGLTTTTDSTATASDKKADTGCAKCPIIEKAFCVHQYKTVAE